MTENLNLIVALPSSLARCLLSDWLDLKDVAHLDSASTNGVNRPQFLDLVSSVVFPIDKWNSECTRQSEYVFVSWLIARAVKVAKLDVSNVQVGRVQALLNVNARHLSSMQLVKTDHLALVAKECSNLVHLNCSGKEIDAAKLYDVLTANPNIHHLDLSCLLAPKNKKPRFVDANCPNLHTLCVSLQTDRSLHIDKFYTQLEKFVVPLVRSVVAQADKLRLFSFRSLYFTESSCWTEVFSTCGNLRTLQMHYSTFREGELISIATKCPHVTNLDITGSHATDADVKHLAQHLTLRAVCLDGCIGLTTASLSALLKHSYATLTALSVVNAISGTESIMHVTMSISAMLTSCKSLVSLGLSSHNMRDGYMQNLSKLRICSPLISDQHLQTVANNCASLQCLYLDESTTRVSSVDIACIQLLLSKCTVLHTLVVKGEILYGVAKNAVAEFGYRVPRIHLSRDADDMKIGVLDLPVV